MKDIITQYREGSLSFPVWDAHSHHGCYYQFPIQDSDAAGMLRGMDAAGIDAVIVTSLASMGTQIAEGNRAVRDMVRAHPDRFLGYVTVNPHHPEESLREMETYADAPEFAGMKIHEGISQCPVDNPKWDPFYKLADERGWLLLSHSWGGEGVRKHATIADRFPNIRLFLGHSGGADLEGRRAAIELARGRENVFLDLTCSDTAADVVEWFVDEIGPQRVLLGSDIPFFDARGAVGWVVFSDIEDAAKELILGGNLRRILGAKGRRLRGAA